MEPLPDKTTDILAPLKKVTPVSKYLAILLFIALPFIGGLIGYSYAPVMVVEVEKIVSDFEAPKAVPALPLSEMQRMFAAQISDRYEISPLYTVMADGVEYFKSFIPNSSGCCRVYKYVPEQRAFFDTGISIDMVTGEKESSTGRYITKVVDQTLVQVYDLETQSLADETTVRSGVETLISETCGYAGYAYDLVWLDEKTLQYGVYKNVDDYNTCPVMELVERRLIELE